MSFHVPEKHRIDANLLLSREDVARGIEFEPAVGNNGAFTVPFRFQVNQGSNYSAYRTVTLRCIASDGGGWEHVSVSLPDRCPTWEMMCHIKDLFWDENDVVIQFHPAKSDYINHAPYCLHLWRPIDAVIPTPPSVFVGPKPGQTVEDACAEYEAMQPGR